ncbi:hypothetical protein MMC10_010736 [Thelotrema lepadinum]|nr:hypothetical protein [Thelotrema lepadinum]
MFTLRRFSHKGVTLPESEATYDQKLPLIEDSEKARLFIDCVPSLPPKHRTKHKKLRFVSKLLFLVFAFAFAFTVFSGQSIKDYATLGYKALLRSNKAHDHVACSNNVSTNRPISIAAPPWKEAPIGAEILSRNDWGFKCSSSKDSDHNCTFAFDGDDDTYWQSADDTRGHSVEIDLRRKVNVHSLAMRPALSDDDIGGSVRQHQVEVATERGSWNLVASGTWRDSAGGEYNLSSILDSRKQRVLMITAEKFATFEPRLAQFVRLTILDTTLEKKYVIIDDINIYTVETVEAAVTNGGKWSLTLNFPLVPVTVFLNPRTQKVVTMASYLEDNFQADKARWTFSATWDAKTGRVEEQKVEQTGHDMFCPGTSYDESGQVVITGGSTPNALTIYDTAGSSYYTPIDNSTDQLTVLKIPRGYHGQTFLPNGKTFMIGGAWSGSIDGDTNTDRDGELYDPASGSSRKLVNVKASYIKMDKSVSCEQPGSPCVMDTWQQHHPWLFAWKENSIFHAGPSKKMNWFFTEPTADVPADGLVKDGGVREDNDTHVAHGDAVCGITSMYDAENGVILAAGGAPNYHYWFSADHMQPDDGHRLPSTSKAFEIKLGGVEPGNIVHPKQVASMNRPRIFASTVILPNGETLVVGGQTQGEPFHDETWESVPEIYSPDTKTWREVTHHSTPRAYHSWAMLLPDASVLVGGGGLSVNSKTDHYDAQIYQPAYLFESDGNTLAKRPQIKTIDAPQYMVGDEIAIKTDGPVDAASLIRYSATTHTVNNDLRRIKLNLTTVGYATDNEYTVQIPSDPGVTLPGYWMLFVLAKGVPSRAETVQILAY